MPAILNLTWFPSEGEEEPPVGYAPGIYRHDTYTLTLRLWADEEMTVPFEPDPLAVFTAQVRAERVVANEDPLDAALATFDVIVSGQDVIVSLDSAVTEDLATDGFWDLQEDLSGVITTWFTGKTKVRDDVTR